MSNNLLSTPIDETWRDRPRVLEILVFESVNLEKAEEWFEPVLNKRTPLSPL